MIRSFGYSLVTGGAGFLGRHVARALKLSGEKVIGLGTSFCNSGNWSKFGYSYWFEGVVNKTTLNYIHKQFGPPHAIYHCAGGSSVALSLENPENDFFCTINSLDELFNFYISHAAEIKIIYPSSAAVYGNSTVSHSLEDIPFAPCSPYGSHKLLAEQLIREYSSLHGFSSSIVRFFSLYGPELRKQLIWDACNKALSGEFSFYGTGSEVRDWLYIDDAVNLLILAEKYASPLCPVVNGGSGHGVSVKNVLTLLAQHIDPHLTPTFSLKEKTGDPSSMIADIKRSAEWGFTPQTSLEEGLRSTWDWFLKEKGL